MFPRVLRAVTAALLASCALAGTSPIADAQRDPSYKAFVGARIIDGTGRAAIAGGVLVVRGGRVVAVGPAARVKAPVEAERIDVAGRTIVPGFINTHGHVGETRGLSQNAANYTEDNVLRQLGLYARYGVTTVFSLGGDREAGFRLRDTQDAPGLARSRLFVAGTVLAPTTPEEARTMVRDLAAQKPDIVKIRVDDNLGTTPKMPAPVYQAVIDEAHKRGLRVAAHLYYLDDAKGLLKAGVDYIAHSIRDRMVDAETIALLKRRGVCVCPTLTREVSTFVYESTPAFFDDPFFVRDADPEVVRQLQEPARQEAMRTSKAAQQYKASLDVASRNLEKLVDAGVTIAFGTDTGPPARFQGYFEHMEADLMAKAGLTPAQILASATGDAARCMKVADRLGTLAAGRFADFIVLDGDPLEDVASLHKINSVWIAGNRIERKAATNDVGGDSTDFGK
jgi:imidazolonepropionase-like amidohydrolase